MYDVVIEPYGGEVLDMSIAATTQLNIFLSVGIMVGIATTGFLLVPRLGKKTHQPIWLSRGFGLCVTVHCCWSGPVGGIIASGLPFFMASLPEPSSLGSAVSCWI